jgi:hypothetical protein
MNNIIFPTVEFDINATAIDQDRKVSFSIFEGSQVDGLYE